MCSGEGVGGWIVCSFRIAGLTLTEGAVSRLTWCLTSAEITRLIREREVIYISLHCHLQNDFCIKMGSDESHFSVS